MERNIINEFTQPGCDDSNLPIRGELIAEGSQLPPLGDSATVEVGSIMIPESGIRVNNSCLLGNRLTSITHSLTCI